MYEAFKAFMGNDEFRDEFLYKRMEIVHCSDNSPVGWDQQAETYDHSRYELRPGSGAIPLKRETSKKLVEDRKTSPLLEEWKRQGKTLQDLFMSYGPYDSELVNSPASKPKGEKRRLETVLPPKFEANVMCDNSIPHMKAEVGRRDISNPSCDSPQSQNRDDFDHVSAAAQEAALSGMRGDGGSGSSFNNVQIQSAFGQGSSAAGHGSMAGIHAHGSVTFNSDQHAAARELKQLALHTAPAEYGRGKAFVGDVCDEDDEVLTQLMEDFSIDTQKIIGKKDQSVALDTIICSAAAVVKLTGVSCFKPEIRLPSRDDVIKDLNKNGTTTATGFFISTELFMTNWHVFANVEMLDEALNVKMLFDFQGKNESSHVVKWGTPNPAKFFWSDKTLDVAIVAWDPSSDPVRNPGCVRVPLHLRDCRPKVHDDPRLMIIGHPDGKPKRISMHGCEVVGYVKEQALLKNRIQPHMILYTNDTESGSSGSPVLSMLGEVIALHHASLRLPIKMKKKAAQHVNVGTHVADIFAALFEHWKGLDKTTEYATLIKNALLLDVRMNNETKLALNIPYA